MIAMGFVENFVGLLVTRIFLGITEAGEFEDVCSVQILTSRAFPGCQLLPDPMVQTIRDQLPNCPFLLCCHSRRSLRWSIGTIDQSHGRCQRLRRLAMDLYP